MPCKINTMPQSKVTTSDGMVITITDYPRPTIANYWFHDNKIWQATSISGVGRDYRVVLERPLTNERVVLKGMTAELQSAKMVIKPTGYIRI